MDPTFWLDRWQRADIGFHQGAAHHFLARHWGELHVPRGASVFVPLSGKSLDMVWLADQGHDVLGVELSELAVEQFFAERSRRPAVVSQGRFKVRRAGPYEIWCGDFFSFDPADTRRIGGVFDRAALVAMPSSISNSIEARTSRSPASSQAYAMSKRLWPATPIRTAAACSGCSAKSRQRR